MNAKKCKRIRRALKLQGINCKTAIYLERFVHTVTAKNIEGKVYASVRAQTNYLAEYCGRAIYNTMKKSNA